MAGKSVRWLRSIPSTKPDIRRSTCRFKKRIIASVRLFTQPGPLAAGFVPAVVETLTRRHPRASVQITDAVLDRLLHELRDRDIDLAIGTSIAPISDEDMESELLF